MHKLVAMTLLAAFAAAPARAAVDVVFAAPETYLDAGLYSRIRQSDRAITMARLEAHLAELGARYLAPGQTLVVEVEDIDLAGELRWLGTRDIRVLSGATWPRIRVRYTLLQDGETVRNSAETIADRSYLMRPSLRHGHDTLRYEKAMLDDWFRRRFAAE